MQINKVEICGVNTSELPVLKNNQMMELLLKIKEGAAISAFPFNRSSRVIPALRAAPPEETI